MAESVNLTAQAQLGIRAEVQNAIIDVLGQSDPNSSMAAAQDVMNLENTISRNFRALTDSIASVANRIGDLRSSQDESSRQNADAALAAEEQISPLSRMANTLDDIFLFLQDQFKPTGLGSEDANVGMLSKTEKEADPTDEQTEKETKKEEKVDNQGSIFVAGVITAAALTAIKDKLEETWSGVTMVILKPFIAIREAIKSLPKLFEKLSKHFPKLSKRIDSIIKAFKNFKLGKFFKPLLDSIKTIAGSGGFGKVISVLKKFALPLTLVMEAFEAFKMIFVGSFSKNAEAMAESISEKGVLGRAFYGFTHMFQTIAAAVKTQFDTIMQTFDILFSNHPDGMVGKLFNIGEIMLTPLVELFKDFVIYPIQKALSYLGLADDPDDAEAARKKDLDEVAAHQETLSEAEQKYITDKAQQYGTSEEEFKTYLKYKEDTDGAVLPFNDWKDSKTKKINDSPAIPKQSDPAFERLRDFSKVPTQQNIQQNSIQNNTTFEVQMPKAGEMLDQ